MAARKPHKLSIRQSFGVTRSSMARSTRRSTNWLANKIRKIDKKKLSTVPWLGRMYLYSYKAKYAATLPYYDVNPLVIIIDKYPGGFLGLNLHYVPPRFRMLFLQKILPYKTGGEGRQRFNIDYAFLKGTGSLKMFRSMIHRYLYSHMRTKFLQIPADEWEEVIMLPVQRFSGSTATAVYKDSRGKF